MESFAESCREPSCALSWPPPPSDEGNDGIPASPGVTVHRIEISSSNNGRYADSAPAGAPVMD